MGIHHSPGFIAFAIVAVPILVAMVGAVSAQVAQKLRDRADGVVTTWAGLRITHQQLVMGYHDNARRIPLAGLRVDIEETGSPVRRHHNHRIHLTIEHDGTAIDRWQPYSRTTRRAAQRFAVQLNLLSQGVDRRELSV
ncbi:hypothetical protein OG976_15675 [Mycobacterium sp. NBC_00419]|uniref:hypothetical protein n=1 Tax=Mycobacterium sp. NBC_00419 TaxID=2975989 RepID=UPI002E23657F